MLFENLHELGRLLRANCICSKLVTRTQVVWLVDSSNNYMVTILRKIFVVWIIVEHLFSFTFSTRIHSNHNLWWCRRISTCVWISTQNNYSTNMLRSFITCLMVFRSIFSQKKSFCFGRLQRYEHISEFCIVDLCNTFT